MLKLEEKGSMLVLTLVATGLFLVVTMGSISLILLQQKLNIQKVAKTQALHIAEAGVNYYRWVLYHDGDEYCNKETCIGAPDYGPYGPYPYKDSAGENITGYYELYITPPPSDGSTIVKIKSVGWTADHPEIKRTIEVDCGIPSWSQYSTLCNSDIRFGEGTVVTGYIHSNGGIRFDGFTNGLITSALLDYDDPDHSGPNEFAVHTHVSPTDPLPDGNNPPQNVPDRSDVFAAGRKFPVPIVSFDLLDSHISDMLNMANTDGLVVPASGAYGYHITLNPDDTLDIKKVTSVTSNCWGTPTEGIASETDYLMNISTPNNGIIFVKDKIWVNGHIDGNRITILAFAEPITGNVSDIIINNDLTYTHKDGTDSIGLIAQRNITVGLYSENDLEIDAALIAKGGRIGRNYYYWFCGSEYKRSRITVYGSLATRNRYGFAYTDGTGYHDRILYYDSYLTFSPPPHFPTTGEYKFLSWRED